MPEGLPLYCDLSLPVPLDRAFTYRLPETLRHRVQPGCRVLAPFGTRKLTGLALRCHDDPPEGTVREVLRLIDAEPIFDDAMLALGRWIAEYYCAPLGEVLRSMAPLAAEVRRDKVYSLTDKGRDAIRQLTLATAEEDTATRLLRLLDQRPSSASYIKDKLPGAGTTLQRLLKQGFLAIEELATDRDPLRAPASRLRVSLEGPAPEGRYKKAERELLAYLELHPGTHNLLELEAVLPKAASAARALGRQGVVTLKFELPSVSAGFERPRHVLNAHQQAAFEQIRAALQARQFRAFLLEGVTGSGKTEVYLNAIEATLEAGRGALLLVPEIALTPAVAGQFHHRFGDRVAILHSAFSDTERAAQWRRIRAGEAGVVVGTRSGVFAPVRDLGLIVVDEEHDGSYKQEEAPRYNGRDVALVRGQAAGACVILGSATPSLESRYNAERGKYTLLRLPERIEQRPLPAVEILDMRQEFLETRAQALFSRRLLEAIGERLASGEQTMLLLNRRGFSTAVACRACGERIQCANCSVTLTFHRRERRLLCHYCNYAEAVPKHCPKCGKEHLYFLGTGAEKVEEELHRVFPKARVVRMDRDTVTTKRHYETILAGFREGNFDILVGTQMIAKGHDIPNVTLVGVVNADIGLGLPDFRAAERIFQLLTQVAGRAGRGDLPGQVLIQTMSPNHYAIRFAAAQDYELFYQRELEFRRMFRYPPFSALANVLVRSQSQADALRMAGEIGRLLTPPPENVKITGPAEAPMLRLFQEYRYQLLIKAAHRKALREVLMKIRDYAVANKWGATALVIDVDPLSLM